MKEHQNRYKWIAAISLLTATGAYAGSDIELPSPNHAPSNALGTIVKTEKDSQGRTIRETDADGRVMTYLYGHDGKVLAKILPDGTKVVGGS